MKVVTLVLGLVVVGAMATPVGAQDGVEGFLALNGIQGEALALSDQDLDAIKGQGVPTFAVLIPGTTCTTACPPGSGTFTIAPCTTVCGLDLIVTTSGGQTEVSTTQGNQFNFVQQSWGSAQ